MFPYHIEIHGQVKVKNTVSGSIRLLWIEFFFKRI